MTSTCSPEINHWMQRQHSWRRDGGGRRVSAWNLLIVYLLATIWKRSFCQCWEWHLPPLYLSCDYVPCYRPSKLTDSPNCSLWVPYLIFLLRCEACWISSHQRTSNLYRQASRILEAAARTLVGCLLDLCKCLYPAVPEICPYQSIGGRFSWFLFLRRDL